MHFGECFWQNHFTCIYGSTTKRGWCWSMTKTFPLLDTNMSRQPSILWNRPPTGLECIKTSTITGTSNVVWFDVSLSQQTPSTGPLCKVRESTFPDLTCRLTGWKLPRNHPEVTSTSSWWRAFTKWVVFISSKWYDTNNSLSADELSFFSLWSPSLP